MSVIDFTDTIIAKSDQLNAADIAGSLTIKITDAKKLQDPDQPVHIFYEGGGKKPWKPCKTMRRVIAQVWGSKVDLKDRMITLICDPKVTWGGNEVGGIRITHMSHIDGKKVLPVRTSRHKVEKYVVLPVEKTAKSEPVQQQPESPTDEALDGLLSDGDDAASLGVQAYKDWLATLEDSEKQGIKHKHAEWSKIAKAADADEELPL
jgi:hypothetical protein